MFIYKLFFFRFNGLINYNIDDIHLYSYSLSCQYEYHSYIY